METFWSIPRATFPFLQRDERAYRLHLLHKHADAEIIAVPENNKFTGVCTG